MSQDTSTRLFPLTAARFTERWEKRLLLRQNREHNRESREREQKRRRYQNWLAQAALELAWLKRFVPCRHIDPWEWRNEPLWRVMLTSQA